MNGTRNWTRLRNRSRKTEKCWPLPGLAKNLRDGPDAMWVLLKNIRKIAEFHHVRHVRVSRANLSLNRKFAQGIESTQRMHFWIAYDLMKTRKLVWSQTNSHIFGNLDFCVQNLHLFDYPVDARFPVLWNYSTSLKGSTNHFEKSWFFCSKFTIFWLACWCSISCALVLL